MTRRVAGTKPKVELDDGVHNTEGRGECKEIRVHAILSPPTHKKTNNPRYKEGRRKATVQNDVLLTMERHNVCYMGAVAYETRKKRKPRSV